jgi:hypothetical protein
MAKGREEPKAKLVQYLPGLAYEIPEREELDLRTQLTSEIAARLLELRDVDATWPFLLMHKLCRVYRLDPFAFWLAVEVLAGDQLQAKSLSELAAQEGETKQATHHRQNRAIATLERTFPDIGEALRAILGTRSFSGVEKEPNNEAR